MACIRIISTTTIQAPPASNVSGDSTRKIHLTPWDIQYLKTYMSQDGLLFHNPKEAKDKSNQIIIHHLKHSLSSTLAFFPPLTGRLIIEEHKDDNNNTATCFIACNNIGALFVHATVENNTSVSDILQPNYVPPIVDSFFPFNGVRNYEGTSRPLLAVQVTELVDGIFIGCAINHMVADGKSFWHFMNSWAELSRGSCHQISKLPVLDRWFPDTIIHRPPPICFPFTKEDKQHSTESECENSSNPFTLRLFHFTKEKIAQLKSKANVEVNYNDKISSLQALLSHIWRTVIHCQHDIDPHEEITYILAIDIRWRMVPSLSKNYFGNAILAGVVTMKAREVLEAGLGKFALELNKIIASHSDDAMIKNHYESWMKTPILFQPLGSRASSSIIKVFDARNSPRFNRMTLVGVSLWLFEVVVRFLINVSRRLCCIVGRKKEVLTLKCVFLMIFWRLLDRILASLVN